MATRVAVLVLLLHLVPYLAEAQFIYHIPKGIDHRAVNGNVINDNRKVLLAPDDDENCIERMGGKFWDTVKWYFANAGLVIVSGIHGDGKANKLDSATSLFNRFFHSVPTLTMFFKFYEKRGFKIIPNSKIIGVLVVAEDLNTLETFFQHTPTNLVESSKSHFLFIILNQAPRNVTEEFVANLWRKHNILNLMIMMPCGKNFDQLEDLSDMVGFLNPFVAHGDLWGDMKWTRYNELNNQPDEDSDLWHGDGNFHGFPIKCEIFIKYPTVLIEKEIPRSFAKSYIQRNAKTPNNFGGIDSLILGTLADKLNFTMVIKIVEVNFGFDMANGTATGTLGDVVRKVTDVSFNNRFMMDYKNVEFLYPIMSDQFCLYAPKAGLIPKWLAIFQCFETDVWFLLLIINFICGFVRYVIKRLEMVMTSSMEKKQPLSRILFETWNAMMSSPSILIPKRTVERFFLAICLLMNVIMIGTFQGSLVTSISTPSSYKDMNTLQDLDESGLMIYMPPEFFLDIFGDGGTKALDSLKSKMLMVDMKTYDEVRSLGIPSILVSRKTDGALSINRDYKRPDGTPMYHVVKECPRNFHMSYIVRSGWAFSTFFNKVLSRLREAGIIDMWYRSTENAILMHKKIVVDRPKNNLKPFNLEDMQTAFLILALGLTACTFVFVVELKWKRWKRRIN